MNANESDYSRAGSLLPGIGRFGYLAAALLVSSAIPVGAAEYPPLQPLIDAAKPNETIRPAPGVYAGPVTIDKPLTLDGGGKVTIDAGGKG